MSRSRPSHSPWRARLRRVGWLVGVLGVAGNLAAQVVFDPAADFSAGSNPGGAWSYGYAATPGGFTPFPLASTFGGPGVPAWRNSDVFPAAYPAVFYNASGAPFQYQPSLILPTGQFGLHPGDSSLGQDYAVARLTLPAGGTFLLNAAFVGLESFGGGTTTDVHVLVGGTAVFDGSIGGFGQTAILTGYSFPAPGGTIVDFVVGNGRNGFNGDTTGLTAIVVAVVPEPATFGLFASLCAALPVVVRRWRRGR